MDMLNSPSGPDYSVVNPRLMDGNCRWAQRMVGFQIHPKSAAPAMSILEAESKTD